MNENAAAPMTGEEKIEFLGGQVLALINVCIVLIKDNPSPRLL